MRHTGRRPLPFPSCCVTDMGLTAWSPNLLMNETRVSLEQTWVLEHPSWACTIDCPACFNINGTAWVVTFHRRECSENTPCVGDFELNSSRVHVSIVCLLLSVGQTIRFNSGALVVYHVLMTDPRVIRKGLQSYFWKYPFEIQEQLHSASSNVGYIFPVDIIT